MTKEERALFRKKYPRGLKITTRSTNRTKIYQVDNRKYSIIQHYFLRGVPLITIRREDKAIVRLAEEDFYIEEVLIVEAGGVYGL